MSRGSYCSRNTDNGKWNLSKGTQWERLGRELNENSSLTKIIAIFCITKGKVLRKKKKKVGAGKKARYFKFRVVVSERFCNESKKELFFFRYENARWKCDFPESWNGYANHVGVTKIMPYIEYRYHRGNTKWRIPRQSGSVSSEPARVTRFYASSGNTKDTRWTLVDRRSIRTTLDDNCYRSDETNIFSRNISNGKELVLPRRDLFDVQWQ